MDNKKVLITYTDDSLKGDIEKIINSFNVKAETQQSFSIREIRQALKSLRGPGIGMDIGGLKDFSEYFIAYYRIDFPKLVLDLVNAGFLMSLFTLAKKKWQEGQKNKTKNNFAMVGDFGKSEIHYLISLCETPESFKQALGQLPDTQKKIFDFINDVPIKAFKIKVVFTEGKWKIDFKTTEFELATCNNNLDDKVGTISKLKKTLLCILIIFIVVTWYLVLVY